MASLANDISSIRMALPLFCCLWALLACVNGQTYLNRLLIPSPSFYFSSTLCYYRVSNKDYYASWSVPTQIAWISSAYGYDYFFTSSLTSISSGTHTQGFQLNVKMISAGTSALYFTIQDTLVNQNSQSFVWYTVKVHIFMAPTGTIVVSNVQALIYATVGNNYFTLTEKWYNMQFNLTDPLKSSCFWDEGKTIWDQVQLIPSLAQVNINDPYMVNLTAPTAAPGWVYTISQNTALLQFSLYLATYVSNAIYVVANVVGFCPHSFLFRNNNITLLASPKNFIQLPNSGGTTQKTLIQLTTPLGSDKANSQLMGLGITGVVLNQPSTPQLFLSVNLTYSTDVMGIVTGYLGQLTTFSNLPTSGYASFWSIGNIGGCPTNLAIFNVTHCFCNPAQNLTYDLDYSLYKCRQSCPFGYYFSYILGSCQSCQVSYTFLCSTCNAFTCFNCTNGLQYYLKNTTVLCIDCTGTYGSLCTNCTDLLCLNCQNNYGFRNGTCTCSGDRYLVDTSCLLCADTFPLCGECTAAACTKCANGYSLASGSCVCLPPYRVVNGNCMTCAMQFGDGCDSCTTTQCMACSNLYALVNSVCVTCASLYGPECVQCHGAKCLACLVGYSLAPDGLSCVCPPLTNFVSNGSCLPCSTRPGCSTCNESVCISCQNNLVLTAGTCGCSSGTVLSNSSCVSCAALVPFCLTCSAAACLSCPPLFQLTSASCVCSGDRYVDGNACVMCSLVGCSSCSSATQCSVCKSTFTLSNGSCVCDSGYVLSGSSCTTCTAVYGGNCLTCDQTHCLSCSNNFAISGGSCVCPPLTNFISNGSCLPCSTRPGCSICNELACFGCQNNLVVTAGTCGCSSGTVLSNSSCVSCAALFPFCLTCSAAACLSCPPLFQLTSASCVCSGDRYVDGNACVMCSLVGCSSCSSATQCTACKSTFTLSNGSCVCDSGYVLSGSSCTTCPAVYGGNCLICDQTRCLSCSNNFAISGGSCVCPPLTNFISNGSCLPCSTRPGCSICNELACFGCQNNLVVTAGTCGCSSGTVLSNSSCVSCAALFPFCLTCSAAACLSCPPLFQLTSASCVCSGDRYVDGNACVMCSLVGCSSCSSATQCTACKSTFTLSNGSCVCDSGYVLSGSSCSTCGVVFGSNCIDCNQTHCLSCINNFVVSNGSCVCPASTHAVVSGVCTICPLIYSNCLLCNTSVCLDCTVGYDLFGGNCVCTRGEYLSLSGDCVNCQDTYQQCLQCQWDQCLSCALNYTLQNRQCYCLSPRKEVTIQGRTSCLSCSEASPTQICNISATIESYQSGEYLYFRLLFQPEGVQLLEDLQNNIKAHSEGGQLALSYGGDNQVFSIHLSGLYSSVRVEFQNLGYVRYGDLQLQGQPSPVTVSTFKQAPLESDTVLAIFRGRNYVTAFLMLLSFGTFNHVGEEINLIAVNSLARPNIPNALGSVLDLLRKSWLFWPLPIETKIGASEQGLTSLKMAVYGLGKPFLDLVIQVVGFGLAGALLVAYVRGYLQTKRQARRHRAFRNVMDHGGQYALDNWNGLIGLLSFPAMIQLKAQAEKGWQMSLWEGVNVGLSVCLLLAGPCLLVIQLVNFSPTIKRYSVLYYEFKSQKALVMIYSLVAWARPFLYGALIVFVNFPINQYFILVSSFIHLFFLLVCASFSLGFVAYLVLLAKTVLGVYVNFVLVLATEDSAAVQAAAWVVLVLAGVEVGEGVGKLGRLILRNKGVLEEGYQPLQGEHGEAAQKRKQLQNKMMSFLGKARDELNQLVRKRPKKQ